MVKEKNVRQDGLSHLCAALHYMGNPPWVVVDEKLFYFIWMHCSVMTSDDELYLNRTRIVCDTPEFNLTMMVAKKRGLFLTAKDLMIDGSSQIETKS